MAGILEQLSKGLFGLAPIPAPNGVFGQVLDSAAQWGRGVQDKAATLADLLKKPLPMDGRANFLPYQDTLPGSVMNQRQLAVPGVLAGALNALTAPARAAQQEYTVDENGNIVSSFNAPEEAQNVAMSMLGGGGVASRGAPSGVLGMNVWHGSPHKFDKFDMSKIGTGEGAQAYGHGIYLAESKKVADEYAGKLSDSFAYVNGKLVNHPSVVNALKVTQYGSKGAAVRDALDNMVRFQPEDAARIGYIDRFKTPVDIKDSGNLYKVDLPDEHIAKMLDWDKPLSQQPESVRKALAQIGITHDAKASSAYDDALLEALTGGSTNLPKPVSNPTGAEIYQKLNSKAGSTWLDPNMAASAQISEKLRALGIPGIRYLDGGSRAGGKGTSNFVVFDDAIPKIIGRE